MWTIDNTFKIKKTTTTATTAARKVQNVNKGCRRTNEDDEEKKGTKQNKSYIFSKFVNQRANDGAEGREIEKKKKNRFKS